MRMRMRRGLKRAIKWALWTAPVDRFLILSVDDRVTVQTDLWFIYKNDLTAERVAEAILYCLQGIDRTARIEAAFEAKIGRRRSWRAIFSMDEGELMKYC